MQTHEVAEAGARNFLDKGGDIESEKDVYGMILDGLRGRALARSEKEVAEYSEKCTDLEDRLMNLYAKLETKKSYNAQDVLDVL